MMTVRLLVLSTIGVVQSFSPDSDEDSEFLHQAVEWLGGSC